MVSACRVQGKEEPQLRLALHRRVGNRSGTRGSLKHFEDWGSSWGWVCGNRGLCGYRDEDQKKGNCNTQVGTELAGSGVWRQQALDPGVKCCFRALEGRAGKLSAIQHGAKVLVACDLGRKKNAHSSTVSRHGSENDLTSGPSR